MGLHFPSSIFWVLQFNVAAPSSQNLMVGAPAMAVEVRAAETPRRRKVLRCMAMVRDKAGQMIGGMKLECSHRASICAHLLTCSIYLCPDPSLCSDLYSDAEP